jgi:hypothetical protein
VAGLRDESAGCALAAGAALEEASKTKNIAAKIICCRFVTQSPDSLLRLKEAADSVIPFMWLYHMNGQSGDTTPIHLSS